MSVVPPQSLVRVSIDSGAELVDPVHVFIAAYASHRFRPSIRERIVLAANELLSNATAYGALSAPIVFELSASDRLVIVRVSNAVTNSRLQMLQTRFKAVNDDPQKTYLEQMQRSMSGRALRAQLGLARLRFEAELSLDLEVVDNIVTVSAACPT